MTGMIPMNPTLTVPAAYWAGKKMSGKRMRRQKLDGNDSH